MGAAELLGHFAARTMSPLECWTAIEARIAAWEPVIAALYAYDPAAARAAATASTARWQRREPRGRLDGLPVTVKELIATAGVPIPLGSAATVLDPAPADAPAAARLREDGAIVFAKTTCPDYGMLSSGLSSFHPLTRNPWNPALNPGGSSAGAAAAAAAGYGPLHLGTDIGGSIRIPAALTGLFGFKPSQGRVPVVPPYVGRCIGPMTRTVADAAWLMPTLAGPDARDGTSLPALPVDWEARDGDLSGLTIGLMPEAGCGLPVDPLVRDTVVRAAGLFADAGASVREVPPVLTRAMLDGLDGFWRARFLAQIRTLPDERRALILPYVLAWVAGAARLDAADVAAGFDQTFAMREACGRLFGTLDAVVSPVLPVVSYPAEAASPTQDPGRPFEHIAFTVPWNMAGQPAASINAGFSKEGLPIGLQIVGPRFGDALVLRLARCFEERRGAAPPWPAAPRAPCP